MEAQRSLIAANILTSYPRMHWRSSDADIQLLAASGPLQRRSRVLCTWYDIGLGPTPARPTVRDHELRKRQVLTQNPYKTGHGLRNYS
ncbi:hypothetical protein McaMca56_004714 [Microsporum canis]